MENSELKSKALNQLKGKWLIAIAVCFVVWAFSKSYDYYVTVARVIKDLNLGLMLRTFGKIKSNIISNIIQVVIGAPFVLGSASYFLNLVRNKDAKFENVFDGFKILWKTILLNMLIWFFVLLWSLLLIIPGIIADISYSMAFYIMRDDPSCSVVDAIDMSRSMMEGNKMRYFVLGLSFIGWILLVVVTFGIAAIWVTPYMEATFANFYEDLKNSYQNFSE